MDRKQFEARVWAKFIKTAAPVFKRGDRVLVGVSGGADSVCLLHFLNYLSKKKSFKVFACHVNHRLRANAARDEKFTKNLCKLLGVECALVKADVKALAKKHRLSIEHAARKARYAAFEKASAKFKANKLAVAHHMDDNAETFFLNLLRGVNIKGLAGIPASRPLNNKVTIVRPLMAVTKEDILNYIKFNKLDFVEDETNGEDKFTRNWVRSTLMPLLEARQPKLKEHLYLFSKELGEVLNERS